MGPDRGKFDFRMIKLETWPKPLDRLTGEGLLIAEGENLQQKKQAICLNSKKDFKQSTNVTLNFTVGSNID